MSTDNKHIEANTVPARSVCSGALLGGRNGKQSVFYDERKRWEPVNRQAAQVLRKATWEQMPPAEPRYLPSPQEQAEALQKAAAARYALLKAESDEKDRQRAMQPKPEPKPKFATCRQHAKRVLRTIHKRKGLPPPTWEEIAAFQKQQPLYGQLLHSPNNRDEPRSPEQPLSPER